MGQQRRYPPPSDASAPAGTTAGAAATGHPVLGALASFLTPPEATPLRGDQTDEELRRAIEERNRQRMSGMRGY